MDNQLDILITLFEEEKKTLETLIKQCLEDFDGPDYQLAHHHQKAKYKVDHTIDVLNRLKDLDNDPKIKYKQLIEKCEQNIASLDNKFLKKLFFEKLQHYKKILEELNALEYSNKSKNDNLLLENALADLIRKKIKKFKIIFNKNRGVFIDFSTKGGTINIVSSKIEKNEIFDSELWRLQQMGFELTKSNKLFFQLVNKGDKSLLQLKYILTRLVFDISYFQHPTSENFLEFY